MVRPAPSRLVLAGTLAALLVASPARAEGPVEGGDLQQQVEELAKKISRALKENEQQLTRLARGDQGKPRDVDIKLPEDGGSPPPTPTESEGGGGKGEGEKGGGGNPGGGSGEGSAGTRASEGLRQLMEGASRSGQSASSGIGELLRLAQQMGSNGSGGEPGEHPEKKPGEGDPQDPGKKEQDPKSEAPEDKPGDQKPGGDPDQGKRNDDKNTEPEKKPPVSDKAPPTARDLEGVFFVRLPDKVREAIRNGDFDRVPEKYRAMVAEWTRLLAEKDKEENR